MSQDPKCGICGGGIGWSYDSAVAHMTAHGGMMGNRATEFLAASEEVAKARTAQANAFLNYRLVAGTAKTDTQAEMQAISETSSYLDVALAKQEIARRRLIG